MIPRVYRAARAFLGITQRDLGSAAGISAQTVADFERGAHVPHANNLQAMRAVFERQGIRFVVVSEQIVGIDFSGFASK